MSCKKDIALNILDELKSKTTFTGLTPLAERSILTALKRRQMQIVQ